MIGLTQSTEITYQGQLQNASAPATGSFDFEFVLFDAVAGGSQVGSTISRSGVAVANGIFTVNLDFGSSFPGANRFLEIRVRQSGGGAFTTLSPRQSVTSAPYSVKSLSSESSSNSATAGNFTGSLTGDVTGTQNSTTVARLQGRNVSAAVPLNDQVLKFNSGSNQWQPAADNTGAGGGVTSVTASGPLASSGGATPNISLGQIPTANIADAAVTSPKIASGQVVKSLNALTDNVTLAAGSNITITPAGNTLTIASTGGGGNPILNQTTVQPNADFNISGSGTAGGTLSAASINAATQYNIGGLRVLSVRGTSNLFAGLNVATAHTTSSNNVFLGNGVGQAITTGPYNTFVGKDVGSTMIAGERNSFYGYASGLFANPGSSNSFYGAASGLNNTGNRNSAFGESAGAFGGTGSDNSYFGTFAGTNNAGNFNTIIGASSDLGGGVNNGTALGAKAYVAQNDSVVLGSIAGTNGATTSARVGIGTSSPSFKLHVISPNGVGVYGHSLGGGAGSQVGIFGNGDSAGYGVYGIGRTGVYGVSSGAGSIAVRAGGGSSWFQGDSTPLADVTGSGIVIGSSPIGAPNQFGYLFAYDYSTNVARNLILNSPGGNVGIGTIAPLSRLDIAVTGDGAELLRFSTERPWLFRQVRSGSVSGLQLLSTVGQKYFEITSSDGANVASFLADSTSSKVGIGTANPIATLDVAGSFKLDILGGGGSVAICRAFNNFIATCSSSARYKTNVAQFSGGLRVIDRLRPVSFNWKEGGSRDIGFVAEEVAAVEPLMVTYNDKGDVEGVKYDRLSTVFVNAIKEQQGQIENQQKQLDLQQAQIESLKALNSTLAKRLVIIERRIKKTTAVSRSRRGGRR